MVKQRKWYTMRMQRSDHEHTINTGLIYSSTVCIVVLDQGAAFSFLLFLLHRSDRVTEPGDGRRRMAATAVVAGR